jgi:hypothetical protein
MSTGNGFLEEVVRDDNILVRGRKEEVDWLAGVLEDGLDGSPGVVAGTARLADVSEAADGDREEIGGIKLCRFGSEPCGESDEGGTVGSSSGISFAAGIGRPLPAATSWCSVHSSLKSFKPRQNGATRRSI